MEGEVIIESSDGQTSYRYSRVIQGRIKVQVGAPVGMRSNIILTTLPYASKAWTWNVAQKSQIRTVMSYIRGAGGVSRWDDVSNEEMYQFLYRQNSKLS